MVKVFIPFLIAAATILGLGSQASALQKYLCIADQSTGFRWNGSKWVKASFNVDDMKFLVREVVPYEEHDKIINFEVLSIGEQSPAHKCFRSSKDGGYAYNMICGVPAYSFMMFFDTLRFQEIHGVGYIAGNDSLGLTPYITIGKCSQIE